MGRYIIRRMFAMIPVLFLISIIAFSLLYLLPGDPALAMLGEGVGTDSEVYKTLRQEMGLNDPVYVQYGLWVVKLAQGDMGTSTKTKERVSDMLAVRLPVTLQLGLMAIALAVIIALPVAIISAVRPGSKLDMVATIGAMAGVAMPGFWLGIVLIFIFALWLRVVPPSGYAPPLTNLGQNLRLMILPVLTLSTGFAAVTMRQTRSALIEVMQDDYITTARSKGLKEGTIVRSHALKNALIPVVTIVGLQVGHIFGGAVIIETIFALPGVGRLMVDSIFNRDYQVVQGAVLVMALAVLLSNLLTDIVYAYLDPRIKYS